MTKHQSNIEPSHTIKSSEQCLKSPDECDGEKRNKKRLIKDSLNNETKIKHYTFDSDNDDGDNQPKPFVKKQIQLVDNQEEVRVEENFNDKKNSKKRKKSQDRQAHLTTTNDPKAQISEQVFDNQQKTINDDEAEPTIDSNNDISFEEEKKKSLAILDQITNAKSLVAKPNTSQEIQPKSILKQTKETPAVASIRTYDFDESKLKTLFNKASNVTNTSNGNGGFQFQFFNNTQPIVLPTPRISVLSKPIPNGNLKISINKFDNTLNDEDDNVQSSLTGEVEDKNATFFFFDIDDRLKDGLESFVRTEDLNELARSWPTKRKEIGEALRTKHRKAIQRKDKHRVFNHRRRQNQHITSNHSSKSNID
ncbi:unnamed protein product [Rotaria socialis]|uniref:Uncharacterized protein n=2 Tax=Rotaria socialis TaxID=392032 RepID=A0A817UEH8_9BILA|nr:unnamed protein product [Rotaria socialis]CAF3330560.1 unnamed protein product [Rotaria socialis]